MMIAFHYYYYFKITPGNYHDYLSHTIKPYEVEFMYIAEMNGFHFARFINFPCGCM